MSNASLKEQLQAVASQLSENLERKPNHEKKPNVKPEQKFVKRVSPKTVKPKWLEHAQYGVELLKAYFPAAFARGNETKPLKKGIKQDLLKRLSTIENAVTEDKACMVKSLSYYVNTAAYHKSVVVGAERVDLDGLPAGQVSLEEANYSNERNQAKLQAKQQRQVAAPSLTKKEEVTS
jgi:ProP effector